MCSGLSGCRTRTPKYVVIRKSEVSISVTFFNRRQIPFDIVGIPEYQLVLEMRNGIHLTLRINKLAKLFLQLVDARSIVFSPLSDSEQFFHFFYVLTDQIQRRYLLVVLDREKLSLLSVLPRSVALSFPSEHAFLRPKEFGIDFATQI